MLTPQDIIDITALIVLRAPEYDGDVRIPLLIDLAYELSGDKIPEGVKCNYALALQVLHWMTISDRNSEGNGGVGSITEEKEGELTIKYGGSNSNLMWYTSDWKADLGQTIWGVELYAFIKRFITPFATRFSLNG